MLRIQKLNQQLPLNKIIDRSGRSIVIIDEDLRLACFKNHFHYTSSINPSDWSLSVEIRRFHDSEPSFKMKFKDAEKDHVAYTELLKIVLGEVTSELWPPIQPIVRRAVPRKIGEPIIGGNMFEDVIVTFWSRYAAFQYNVTSDIAKSSNIEDIPASKTEYGWIGYNEAREEVIRVADGASNHQHLHATSLIYNGTPGRIRSIMVGVNDVLGKQITDVRAVKEGKPVEAPISPQRRELLAAQAARTATAAAGTGPVMSDLSTATKAESIPAVADSKASPSPAPVNPLAAQGNLNKIGGGLKDAIDTLNASAPTLRKPAEPAKKAPRKPATKKAPAKKAVPKK